jgi:hypothetical protein
VAEDEGSRIMVLDDDDNERTWKVREAGGRTGRGECTGRRGRSGRTASAILACRSFSMRYN